MTKDPKLLVALFVKKVIVSAIELRLDLLQNQVAETAAEYRTAVEELLDLSNQAKGAEEAKDLLQEVLNKKSA